MPSGGFTKVEITGLDKLYEKLIQLDDKVAKDIIRKSLRDGAKVTNVAAKSNVPERTGALRQALKVRAGGRRRGFASITVGVGKKWFSGQTFYGAFVEFGHKVGSRKLGNNRTQVAGEHFIEFAFDESKFAATEAIISTAMRLIERAAAEGAENGG